MRSSLFVRFVGLLVGFVLLAACATISDAPQTQPEAQRGPDTAAVAVERTYTLDADFDEGTLINVNHLAPNNDQLQLDAQGDPFNFIWVAASARGTIVKIDTTTGAVLGEYRSAPEGFGLNPSRTTVDANGNVWAGNRNESGILYGVHHGSVVKIGLEENGQCVDRNGNGVIDTSTGLGDVLAWVNVDDGFGSTDGAAHAARVQDAADECILLYQRTPDAEAIRHVSVDADNNVWVGGYPFAQRYFYKLNGETGLGMLSFNAADYGCGGYGGLIDGNGVLWSASISQNRLLRYDPATDTGGCIPVSQSYGLGIDSLGFVWNSMFSNNQVVKISPAGVIQAGFPQSTFGASGDRGVAVTTYDDHVWIANSAGSDVSRLRNDGTFVTTVAVGSNPTGVAVDAAGKVWVTNLSTHDAMRIDPATNLVDLTVDLNAVKFNGLDAGPYNYSDMTGATLTAAPDVGTWEVVYDSGMPGLEWGYLTWTADEPGDSSLTVEAASSDDGVTFSPPEAVAQDVDLTVPNGRYLKVTVRFVRATGNGTPAPSPVLYDLTLRANRPPECGDAYATPDEIWPPNHKFVEIAVLGVTDPDGDAITLTVDAIFQDEPVDSYGDGRFTPDGRGIGSDTAEVRAERSGTKKEPGNGRVYHIDFTAEDGRGGLCTGEVTVSVPHDQRGAPAIDDGALYDSTLLTP